MGFQEYRSGLPFPPPGDLPDPGVEPGTSALAGVFLTAGPPGKPVTWEAPVKDNMVLGKLNIYMQKDEIGLLSYTTHKN